MVSLSILATSDNPLADFHDLENIYETRRCIDDKISKYSFDLPSEDLSSDDLCEISQGFSISHDHDVKKKVLVSESKDVRITYNSSIGGQFSIDYIRFDPGSLGMLMEESMGIIRGLNMKPMSVEFNGPEVEDDYNTEKPAQNFDASKLMNIGMQMEPFAKFPYLGLIEVTYDSYPFQTATFINVGKSKDISRFFKKARDLDKLPLRKLLSDQQVAYCNGFMRKNKPFERSLAYLASRPMEAFTYMECEDSVGWFNVPDMGLTYMLTKRALAVCYLVDNGVNTALKMHEFISSFNGDLVAVYDSTWDDNYRMISTVAKEGDDRFRMMPISQARRNSDRTIFEVSINYPQVLNTEATEKERLDHFVDLGLFKYDNKMKTYSLSDR